MLLVIVLLAACAAPRQPTVAKLANDTGDCIRTQPQVDDPAKPDYLSRCLKRQSDLRNAGQSVAFTYFDGVVGAVLNNLFNNAFDRPYE
ncbi:hypothetical protein [uncultured Gilvimarinus sp.]|uniref:hypothetical protein n=1 Tax=uncultured Gilvimarinus sp. TaxID=1689143 RepID=UPI0030ECCEB9|tara:strand:- start:4981 stop:5247 length:267 start_codon:yes stop_codon:yes gene_type:complete